MQGVAIEGGTLDLYAHILDVETVNSDAVLAVEVKNIHQWIWDIRTLQSCGGCW